MRLIDADAIKLPKGFFENVDNVPKFYEWLNTLPTIDPVKHGKWRIKTINTFDLAYGSTGYEPVYECSVCGAVEESYLRLDEPIMPEDADFPNYCPNCGTLMERSGDE